MTEPCDLSAVDARRLIGARQLSSAELVESCIARIEAVNPAVNAVITKAYDRARDEATDADATVLRGDALPPLHGLPIGIKDLDDTAGIRTTYGSMLYKDHVPETDEHVVAAARSAGAIVLGKTNTPEFGAGGNTNNALHGPTRNPFDPTLTCGGSSGGSAVALATNMMPLCQGSDTGGSLRLPATFNGVVAHRPSPGLVPTGYRDLAFTTFQTQGPMARTVEDTALLLSALAANNSGDPMAFPRDPAGYGIVPDVDLSRLRVAVSEDLGCAPTSKVVRAAFRECVAAVESAFAVCEQCDPDFTDILDVFWNLRAVYMLAKHGHKFERYGPELNPNVRSNYEAALKVPIERVAWATRRQMELYAAFDAFFDDFDILLCPGVTVPPFPFDQLYPTEIDGEAMENYVHWAGLTSALTVTGNPALALPCGLGSHGTPFGIQVVGRAYADRFVLGAARALEEVFSASSDLARPVPDLAALQ